VGPADDAPHVARAGMAGGSAIAVSVVVMNLTNYVFTLVAARLLGPQPFGAFAAVMNVLLVAAVLQLALQTTAARRIAHDPGDIREVEDAILTVGLRATIGIGIVFLALAPVIDHALRLDSIGTALMLGVAVAPTTLFGAQAGVLQGERRWMPLALMYLAAGVPRLVVGLIALLVQPSETMAMASVAVCSFLPVLIGGRTLSRLRATRGRAATTHGDHSPRALWWETVSNSQALLAFLVLSNVDIVIARNALHGHDAGLYAGGLILVKAVLFLPQFVVVLAFPSMGTDDARRSSLLGSLGLVFATGLAVVAGTAVLSSLAVVFVGGHQYAAIEHRLWEFAVLGTLLSLLQLLVYSVLARQARESIVLLWIGLAALVAAGLTSHSVTQLLGRVITVDATLFAVLLAVSLWKLREPKAV
jgi:O-antigen/teichoic acid export membrane protein